MTIKLFAGVATIRGDAPELPLHERSRYRAAAGHAHRVYPGPLGELVFRELSAYAELGYRFDSDGLIPRLATTVLGSRSDEHLEEVVRHDRRGDGELARTAVECWNRSDWAGYRPLTGPGYVYEEAGTGRRVDDVEALLVAWGRLRAAFPDAAAEIVQMRSEAEVTVARVIWRATQTGPLITAAGVGVESPS